MKSFLDMTDDEKLAEGIRRTNRRAHNLPLAETLAEAAQRVADDDTRLEKQIQKDVMDLYRAHGCAVYSFSQPRATKQTPGIGDLYVFYPPMTGLGPTAWWHETKTPTGKQRPDQVQFQQFCDACGQGYVLGGVAAAAKLREIGALRG